MALIEVVITFVALPEPPTAETDLSKVTVVAEYEVVSERYESGETTASDCDFEVLGLAEALGIESSELTLYFAKDVYAKSYTDNATLASLYDNSGVVNSISGEGYAADPDGSYQLTFADMDYYYYDATDDNGDAYVSEWVYFTVNQENGMVTLGDTITTYIYVMNGDKAVRIKHTLIYVADKGLSDYTVVGSADFSVSQTIDTSYATVYIYPDVDAIAAALGCTTSDFELKALSNASTIATSSTANNGGWWFNSSGYVTSWGSNSAIFIEPYTEDDYSLLSIGQYPGGTAAGDVYTVTLYATYGTNIYSLNITYTITEKEDIVLDEMTNMGTRTITVEQLLDSSYAWSDSEGLSFSVIEELIGTTSPTLLGVDTDGLNTDSYTMDPTPGFWLTSDGYVTSWGSDSYWGFSIGYEASSTELLFNCIQFPDLTAEGDIYNGTFYLVNSSENKMMTINLVYKIVSEIVTYTEVGDTTLVLSVSSDEKSFAIDIPGIAELMGVTEDELYDSYCLCATSGYTTTNTPSGGLEFNLSGECVEPGDGVFGIYIENGEIYTFSNADIEDDFKATAQICFQLNSCRYIIDITFLSEDLYTGINNVEVAAPSKSNAIYDLSGRRVSKAVKGVYIQNGVKILK